MSFGKYIVITSSWIGKCIMSIGKCIMGIDSGIGKCIESIGKWIVIVNTGSCIGIIIIVVFLLDNRNELEHWESFEI